MEGPFNRQRWERSLHFPKQAGFIIDTSVEPLEIGILKNSPPEV